MNCFMTTVECLATRGFMTFAIVLIFMILVALSHFTMTRCIVSPITAEVSTIVLRLINSISFIHKFIAGLTSSFALESPPFSLSTNR